MFYIECKKITMCDLLVNFLLQVNSKKTTIFWIFKKKITKFNVFSH